MTLVHSDTGEIANLLTKQEAEALTAKIKGYVSSAWRMLVEAHDRQAWRAMGYGSWAEYVGAEFDISRQHAYRMLDQGRVINELSEAAGVSPSGDTTSTSVDISEAAARDIKPQLEAVKEAVAAAVADLPPDAVQERTQAVAAVVEQHREPTVRDRHPQYAARQTLGEVAVKVRPLLELPPAEVAAAVMPDDRKMRMEFARELSDWIDVFIEALKNPALRSVK